MKKNDVMNVMVEMIVFLKYLIIINSLKKKWLGEYVNLVLNMKNDSNFLDRAARLKTTKQNNLRRVTYGR